MSAGGDWCSGMGITSRNSLIFIPRDQHVFDVHNSSFYFHHIMFLSYASLNELKSMTESDQTTLKTPGIMTSASSKPLVISLVIIRVISRGQLNWVLKA